MGKRNRIAVMTMWAPLLRTHYEGRALALAYTIADRVPDGETEWWGSQRFVAEVLGLLDHGELTESARQAARRTVRRLVEVGLLEQTRPAEPGRAAEYRVHWKEPPIWPSGGL